MSSRHEEVIREKRNDNYWLQSMVRQNGQPGIRVLAKVGGSEGLWDLAAGD